MDKINDRSGFSDFSSQVKQELDEGLEILRKVDKNIISFFGGSRILKGSKEYSDAEELAKQLSKKNYAILTGGGPGIMHAANKAAISEGTVSLSFSTKSLEQISEPIFTHQLRCRHLFVARFLLAVKSAALVFYPGGYGTLNELFEYLVLMQTGIVNKAPLICVGKEYWEGLFKWLQEHLVKLKQISEEDLKIARIVDSTEEVIKIISENATQKKIKV